VTDHLLMFAAAGVIPVVFLVAWLFTAGGARASKSGKSAAEERAFLWHENRIAFLVVLALGVATHLYLGHTSALWSAIEGKVVTSEERTTRRGAATTWVTVLTEDGVRELSSEGLSASDCRSGYPFKKDAWSYEFTCGSTVVAPTFQFALFTVPLFACVVLWRLGRQTV